MNNIINDSSYRAIGDKSSNRKTYFTKTPPKLIENIGNKTFEEIIDNSDDIQGENIKSMILSNINDIYTRLEKLLGLKL